MCEQGYGLAVGALRLPVPDLLLLLPGVNKVFSQVDESIDVYCLGATTLTPEKAWFETEGA